MTAILAFLADAWPFLLAAAGALFGWARHKQAQTTVAKAKQELAEKDATVAKDNAQAARTGATNAKVKTNEDNAAAAVPDPVRVLHDEWGNGRN